MHAHATTLSDQDMQDVAAFLGGEELKPWTRRREAIVGKAPASLAVCVACHGQDGKGIMGIYPTLRGQHADYLERVLNDYISGARKNGIMAPFASQLKPGDVREIARFFERQRPGAADVPLKERGQRRDYGFSRRRNCAIVARYASRLPFLRKPWPSSFAARYHTSRAVQRAAAAPSARIRWPARAGR